MEITTERPAQPAGEPSYQLDLSPEESFEALVRIRSEAEAEVERLIGILDEIDAIDEDREDGGDDSPCDDDERESEFATTSIEERKPGGGSADWAAVPWLDGAELDEADNEPSLGAAENHIIGSPPGIWASPGTYRDGTGNQTNWTQGDALELEGDGCPDDREHDDAELSGIGDMDGYNEQMRGESSLGWVMSTTRVDSAETTASGATSRPASPSTSPSCASAAPPPASPSSHLGRSARALPA